MAGPGSCRDSGHRSAKNRRLLDRSIALRCSTTTGVASTLPSTPRAGIGWSAVVRTGTWNARNPTSEVLERTGQDGKRQRLSLITRRSQVQILPPPPSECAGQAPLLGVGPAACSGGVYRVIYRLRQVRLADLGLRWDRAGRRLPGVGGEEGGELLGGRCAHAGEQVLVGVDGEGDVGVAEPFADDLDGHAVHDQQRRVGVP